jgi:putative flippase GtrA
MSGLIKIWILFSFITPSKFCFAQTQNNHWTEEILYYIFFDVMFLVAIIVLVKLICIYPLNYPSIINMLSKNDKLAP